MKKVLCAMVVFGLVLAGSACFAEGSRVYVKGVGKYVMPTDPTIGNLNIESDNAISGWGGAVGLTFNQFRVEGEITTQKTDIDSVGFIGDNTGRGIDSGDLRMTTYMVNGYFDLPVSNGFGFYVTGGLGYGTATVSVYNIDGDDSGFAWKVGAGVSYAFTDNMAVDLGWEYLSMEDADLDVTVSDLASNNIYTAFRYTF